MYYEDPMLRVKREGVPDVSSKLMGLSLPIGDSAPGPEAGGCSPAVSAGAGGFDPNANHRRKVHITGTLNKTSRFSDEA
jgi:hypothetical protein